jgi:hypothetical protein
MDVIALSYRSVPCDEVANAVRVHGFVICLTGALARAVTATSAETSKTSLPFLHQMDGRSLGQRSIWWAVVCVSAIDLAGVPVPTPQGSKEPRRPEIYVHPMHTKTVPPLMSPAF